MLIILQSLPSLYSEIGFHIVNDNLGKNHKNAESKVVVLEGVIAGLDVIIKCRQCQKNNFH